MNIRLERAFPSDAAAATVRDRLGRWATKYALTCIRDESTEWEFWRGSHLAAAFTFDIRKVPTVATVTLSQGKPNVIQCSMHVASPWSITTPGDPQRVEEQLELLMAYLKGAFDE